MINEKRSIIFPQLKSYLCFPEVLGNRFLIEYNTENKVAYITDHCLIPIRYVNEFQQLLRLMSNKVEQVKQILNNFVV